MTEKDDLLETLAKHRALLRGTLRGLDDAAAATRTTASELTLGGLVKHVTGVERRWVDFLHRGPDAMAHDPSRPQDWADGFRMLPGETLEALLADFDACGEQTAAAVAALPDLEGTQPLPPAPWFPPGTSWSARRVLLHLVAEISQHAGHADILRESLDGARSMG